MATLIHWAHMVGTYVWCLKVVQLFVLRQIMLELFSVNWCDLLKNSLQLRFYSHTYPKIWQP